MAHQDDEFDLEAVIENKQKEVQNMILDSICTPELLDSFHALGFQSDTFEQTVTWDPDVDCYVMRLSLSYDHRDELDIEELQKMISFAKNKKFALSVKVAPFDPQEDEHPSMGVVLRGYARKLIGKEGE